MGDGEINEGSVWEAALCAGKHQLANLTAIIDYNKIQSAGSTRDIQDLEPLADKWRAFGFARSRSTATMSRRCKPVVAACRSRMTKPTAIICHTVKGKGIPFAENDPNWHHKTKFSRRGDRRASTPRWSDQHAQDLPQHGLRARQAR